MPDTDFPRPDTVARLEWIEIAGVQIHPFPQCCTPETYSALLAAPSEADHKSLKTLDSHIARLRELRRFVKTLNTYFYDDPAEAGGVNRLNLDVVMEAADAEMVRAHNTLMVYRSLVLRKMGRLDEHQSYLKGRYLERESLIG